MNGHDELVRFWYCNIQYRKKSGRDPKFKLDPQSYGILTNMDGKDTHSTKIAKITRKRLMESVVPKNTREIILDQTPLLVKAIERKIFKIL